MTLNDEIILYWSDEDGLCVAEVPELPGCMAHGATQEAAMAGVDFVFHAAALKQVLSREFFPRGFNGIA